MTTDQGNSCRLTAVEAFNTCRLYITSVSSVDVSEPAEPLCYVGNALACLRH